MRATMSSKGQVTIPAEMRAQLSIKPGDKLDFVQGLDGVFRIYVRKKTSLMDLAGCVPGIGRTVSIEEMNQAVMDEAVARHLRVGTSSVTEA